MCTAAEGIRKQREGSALITPLAMRGLGTRRRGGSHQECRFLHLLREKISLTMVRRSILKLMSLFFLVNNQAAILVNLFIYPVIPKFIDMVMLYLKLFNTLFFMNSSLLLNFGFFFVV
ncbi:hypothetical protein DITRI_Ditri06bG0086100 [Diplodiscus trichospermus]